MMDSNTPSPPPLARGSRAAPNSRLLSPPPPPPPPKRQRTDTMSAPAGFHVFKHGDTEMGDETEPDDDEGGVKLENDPILPSFTPNSLNPIPAGGVEHAGEETGRASSNSIIDAGGFQPSGRHSSPVRGFLGLEGLGINFGRGFQATPNSPTRPSSPAESSSSTVRPSSPPLDDSIESYKRRLCFMLKIEYEEFKDISLENLRAYCRLYHGHLRGNSWEPPTGMFNFNTTAGTIFIKGIAVRQGDLVGFNHQYRGFVVAYSHDWIRIAAARGDPVSFEDIDDTNDNTLQETKGTFISPGYGEAAKKALGWIDNPFGRFPGYV